MTSERRVAQAQRPLLAAVESLLLLLLLGVRPASGVEGGYASLQSVAQGGQIAFHISTASRRFSLEIYREGSERTLMETIQDLPGRERSCSEPAYETGCGWPITLTFEVPSDWPSGVYTADFDTEGGQSGKKSLVFVVREDAPGSTSGFLFVRAVNTDAAYNPFGGKSLYKNASSGGEPARTVSFERPYEYFGGTGNYSRWEHHFVAWAEARGYALEYATDVDLHEDATFLGHYACLILVGHDEYWTREMRDHVDAFTRSGGNLAILGGNTCWWQARLDLGSKTLTCYKSYALDEDPLALDRDRQNDRLVTTNWYRPPVNDPENSTTGLGWRHGGYHDRDGNFTYAQGFGGYRVYRTAHWVFAGTDLEDGDMLGRDATIVGYEVDGTLLEARDRDGDRAWDEDEYYPAQGALPYPVRMAETRTPPDFTVLGVAPATSGHAVMGYFETPGGGRVFNAGTIDWAHGLASDDRVARITANVLDMLGGESSRRSFRRGDANADGKVNVSDAVSILSWRFRGGAGPGCLDAADANGDEKADVADAIYLVLHLFQGGAPPPAPGRLCGPSAAPSLGCEEYPRCEG